MKVRAELCDHSQELRVTNTSTCQLNSEPHLGRVVSVVLLEGRSPRRSYRRSVNGWLLRFPVVRILRCSEIRLELTGSGVLLRDFVRKRVRLQYPPDSIPLCSVARQIFVFASRVPFEQVLLISTSGLADNCLLDGDACGPE